MSSPKPPPSLAEFLAAPAETVAAVAPPTAVYAASGSRRHTHMEGRPLDESYADYYRPKVVENCALFFRLGVQHLVIPSLGPRNLDEVGNEYGKRILAWIRRALCGPEMIADYQRRGWRARIILPSPLEDMRAAAADLVRLTPNTGPTVWYYIVADDADPWKDLLGAALQSGAHNREELIRALYGENIPPATLYVGFGKLVTGSTLIPPALMGANIQCYWTQRAGLGLTEEMLRRILYDYAYARHTWQRDRSERYTHSQQADWDTKAIIGVGSQVAGFWYPDPFPLQRSSAEAG